NVRKNSGGIDQSSLNDFFKNHSEKQDNLNIVPLLCCPISKGDLTLTQDKNYLVSATAGRKFPIINKIPLLISSQSEPI
ncbi:MAG TPA: Trm112 family protein, partial [Puia sp.]|nr:Trm112 family protein [Puia sp.]